MQESPSIEGKSLSGQKKSRSQKKTACLRALPTLTGFACTKPARCYSLLFLLQTGDTWQSFSFQEFQ